MSIHHKKLYHRDSAGRIRHWWIEQDEDKYRTNSGLVDGATVTSTYRVCKPRNVGKVNETTGKTQCDAVIASTYEKRTYNNRYVESIDRVDEAQLYISPMLAGKYKEGGKTQFPVASQPKLDGIRCICRPDGMWTRNGKPLVSSPHIHTVLMEVFRQNPGIIFDGELYNHDLKEDFEKIVSLVRKMKLDYDQAVECRNKVQYHVYDLIDENDESMSFDQRRSKLKSLVEALDAELGDSNPVKLVPTHICVNQDELDEKYVEYLSDGYEGQMVRSIDSVYEFERCDSLLKRKIMLDDEFKIVDLEEGQGNWSGMIKSVIIELKDGSTQRAGMRGNEALAKMLMENRESYKGTLATVAYQGITAYGKMRFPIVTKFWGTETREL